MRNRLFAVCTGAAVLVLFSVSPALAAGASSSTVPPALQPALYAAMAKDAGPAEAIGRDGCATLATLHLTACFGKGGVRFSGKDAPLVSLHLAAYGRGSHMATVTPVNPTIQGNRASYAHGDVTEWWRVLPVGFEQGFTVAKRPAGKGDFTLELAANRKATTHGDDLSFGKLDYGKLVVTDAKEHVVPATLKSEGRRILIAVNDTHAAYPLTVDPLAWIQQQKLTENDGAADDNFGYSVALDGTTALVGTPQANVGGQAQQGAAYVFTNSGGSWSQTAELTADDGLAGYLFGWSVALSGTTALVGSPFAPVGGNANQGSAYVFTDSGGTWSQAAKLTADDGTVGANFGYSVATSGTTVIVGAPGATVGSNAAQGASYVFTESGGTWSQAAKLIADDGASNDQFGWSVAVDNTTALVGVPYSTVGNNGDQGSAYLFDGSGGTWNQTTKLTAGDGGSNDQFGWSVALSGTTAVAGAPLAGIGNNPGQGAAYVFADAGGTWNQTAKLAASDGAAYEQFGTSIALDGTTVLAGAPDASVGGNGSQGAAYLFAKTGGVWNQEAKLSASDGAAYDYFGSAVAIAGVAALAGSPDAEVGGNLAQGAAYVYTAACPQGYGEHDGTLSAGGLYGTMPYQAPAGLENGILGGPAGFKLYARYSNGGSSHVYLIPGNEIHKLGPAGTYRWGVKAGNTGGNYVLCILHP